MIADGWETKLTDEYLLTKHREDFLLRPTDIEKGVPIYTQKISSDVSRMDGARRRHRLSVLNFTKEMYQSVPSSKRIVEIKDRFASKKTEDVYTKYYDVEESFGVAELWSLFEVQGKKLEIVTPYSKHTFRLKEGEAESLKSLITDDYNGVIRDPENMAGISEPMYNMLKERFGSYADSAIKYFYNKRLFENYVEELKKSNIEIEYEGSSGVFDKARDLIQNEHTTFEYWQGSRKGRKGISNTVIKNVGGKVIDDTFKSVRNPAANWNKGVSYLDQLSVRSGIGLDDIASIIQDRILEFANPNEKLLNQVDSDFAAAMYAFEYLATIDRSKILELPNRIFQGMKFYDAPIFNSKGKLNVSNIARHSSIVEIETQLTKEAILKRQKNFISDVQQSFTYNKPLTEPNALILAHILGLDELTKIDKKDIILAYKEPSKYLDKMELTDSEKAEPIYRQRVDKYNENNPFLLIHEYTRNLIDVEEQNKAMTADVSLKTLLDDENIDFKILKKSLESEQLQYNQSKTPDEVVPPATQGIIDILNDGFTLRMPPDATPKDFLKANIKLADIMLDAKSRRIASAYYESRNHHLTSKGKQDFMSHLGDIIESKDAKSGLIGEQFLLLQNAARFVDNIWLAATDVTFSKKTRSVWNALFQPGKRSYLAAVNAGYVTTRNVKSYADPIPDRQPDKPGPLEQVQKEQKYRPQLTRGQLYNYINSPIFEPTQVILSGVDKGELILKPHKYTDGGFIELDVLYRRLLTLVQTDNMIYSKQYQVSVLGGYQAMTQRTIVHKSKENAIKNEVIDFQKYLFEDEKISYSQLWKDNNVLMVRNIDQLEFLKTPPKLDELKRTQIIDIPEKKFDTIVAAAKQREEQGLPVPFYLLDANKLKQIYPRNESYKQSNIHSVPTFINDLITYRRGNTNPDMLVFVNEQTFNKIQKSANMLFTKPLGNVIETSLIIKDAESRKIPDGKGNFLGRDDSIIPITNREINSLYDAYIDTTAYSGIARKSLFDKLPTTFFQELSHSLGMIHKGFSNFSVYKKFTEKVSEAFVKKDIFKNVSPEVADWFKEISNALKNIVPEVVDEIRVIIEDPDFRDRPAHIMNVFAKCADELTPVVHVAQVEFLHKMVEELGEFIGERGENLNNEQFTWARKSVYIQDHLKINKLTAIQQMLGLEGQYINNVFDSLAVYASKIEKDPNYLRNVEIETKNEIFNYIYEMQHAVFKKYEQFNHQADVLILALTRHTPSQIDPDKIPQPLRRRAYGLFYSGAILPSSIKNRERLHRFTDQAHFEKVTNLELSTGNVIKYLKEIGLGRFDATDAEIRLFVNKHLEKQEIQLPPLTKQADPQVLIEVLNQMQEPSFKHGSYFGLASELSAINPFSAQRVGDSFTYKTDAVKIMGEIIIGMRASAKIKEAVNGLLKMEGSLNVENTLLKIAQNKGINPILFSSYDSFNKQVMSNINKMIQSQPVENAPINQSLMKEVPRYAHDEIIRAQHVAEQIMDGLGIESKSLTYKTPLIKHRFADGTNVILPVEISDHLRQLEETILGAGQSHGTASPRHMQRIVKMIHEDGVKADTINAVIEELSVNVGNNKFSYKNEHYFTQIKNIQKEFKLLGLSEFKKESEAIWKKVQKEKNIQQKSMRLIIKDLPFKEKGLFFKENVKRTFINLYHDTLVLSSVMTGPDAKQFRKIFQPKLTGLTALATAGTYGLLTQVAPIPAALVIAGLSSYAWKAIVQALPNKEAVKSGRDAIIAMHHQIEQLRESSDPDVQINILENVDKYNEAMNQAAAKFAETKKKATEDTIAALMDRYKKKDNLTEEESRIKAEQQIGKEDALFIQKYYDSLGFNFVNEIGQSMLQKLTFGNINANIKMHTTVGTMGTAPYFVSLLFGNLQQMLLSNINTGFSMGQIAGMVGAGVISDSVGTLLLGGATGGIMGSQIHSMFKTLTGQASEKFATIDKLAKETGLFSRVPNGPSMFNRPKQVAGIMMMEQSFSRNKIMPKQPKRRMVGGALVGAGLGYIAGDFTGSGFGAAVGAGIGALGPRGAAITGGAMGAGTLALAMAGMDPTIFGGVAPGLVGAGVGLGLGGATGQILGGQFENQSLIRQKGLGKSYVIPPVIAPDGRVYSGYDIHRMMSEYNVGTSYLRAETAEVMLRDLDQQFGEGWRETMSWLGGDRFKKIMIEFSESLDRYQRIQTFIDELEKGTTPKDAADLIRETFYDYADLTEFEKNVLRNVFLFYSFARKNFDFLTAKLMEDPGKVLRFLRLRRDLTAETTDYIDPELVFGKWYMGRFALPGFNQFSHNISNDVYNLRTQGKGMFTGKWFPVSPLTVDYDYFVLAGNLLAPLKHGASLEKYKESIGYFAAQTTPIIQSAYVAYTGKQFFLDKDVQKIDVDLNDIIMMNQMAKSYGGTPIFGLEGDGFINLKWESTEELLALETQKSGTRKSLSVQEKMIRKSMLSPILGYGRYVPKNESDALKYYFWKNVVLPGMARELPGIGVPLATRGGRTGSHYTELDRYDTGTYILGKQAATNLLTVYFMTAGKSFSDVMEETKNLTQEQRVERLKLEILATQKYHFTQNVRALPGQEINERSAGFLAEAYFKHPDVPAEVGLARMLNIHYIPEKTIHQMAQEYFIGLQIKLREIE